MREFFIGITNVMGMLCTGLVLIFMSIKAFGGTVVYNDAFFFLVLISITWLILGAVSVRGK